MVVGNGYVGEESVGIKQVNSTSITICFVLFDVEALVIILH
jgi:hypothetical protein